MEDHNIILTGHAYYIKLYRGKYDIYSPLTGQTGKNTWKVFWFATWADSDRPPRETTRPTKAQMIRGSLSVGAENGRHAFICPICSSRRYHTRSPRPGSRSRFLRSEQWWCSR